MTREFQHWMQDISPVAKMVAQSSAKCLSGDARSIVVILATVVLTHPHRRISLSSAQGERIRDDIVSALCGHCQRQLRKSLLLSGAGFQQQQQLAGFEA
ncbi:MAG: hypothetical protein JWN74_173 [Acidobacteriaceae bacterium]|nr:hypothetical protein [Acidobacteriaceae bacterium]